MRVYLIENSANGKRYVGITTYLIEERWKQHVAKTRDPQNNQLVVRAIAKYGVDAFTIKLLEECESVEQMLAREQHWIQELKTNCNTEGHHGYNMTLGGEGTFGVVRSAEYRRKLSISHRRENLSEETLARMSESARNRPPLSEEGREKISERMKGENNPFYGKDWGRKGPLSEEAKAKISAARKGKPLSEEHKAKISAKSKLQVGPNLGRKFTDEELIKKRAAMGQKKKPVVVYKNEVPHYVCFSFDDAIVQSGVTYRKISRSVEQKVAIGELRFERSEQTISEVRSSNVTLGVFKSS